MSSLITAFIAIAVVLIACAVALIATPLLRSRTGQGNAPIAAIVAAVALPATAVLFYVTVSNHDWTAPVRAAAAPARTPTEAGALSDLVAGLEQRMNDNPDDVAGWLLLGRTYVQLQRLPDARRAFEAAVALEPSGDARLSIAEVDIMTDRSNLAGDAGREVEKVLAEEPDNQKALFYGGMVALARGDTGAVGTRWRKLLAMSPPDNVRHLLEQELAQLGLATEPAGPAAAMSAPAPGARPPTDDGGFAVSVSIADELAQRIGANAILFVLARRPGVPGPPIAAVRAAARQLPVSLRISDANVMMEGQSLAGHDALELVARVSNGGGPIAASGDLFGAVTWSADDDDRAVSIVIDQIVE